MNKQEKKKFIKEFTKSLSNDLIAKVNRMPENWDGIEIRQLAKDLICSPIEGKRKKEFENDCNVLNI